MPEVAIALSGGVDSSVAAALLLDAGRDVFGVTMRLGLAEVASDTCCGEDELALARRVCAHLGIPHMVIDLAEEFRVQVVEPFCAAYAAGLTPNPCVRCNERIKLGVLAEKVKRLGASTLATGHYARLERDERGTWLARGADAGKDQSYFLYRVPPETLEMLEFPLGDLTKSRVKEIAALRGLPTVGRHESQEVCFTTDHAALVAATHPETLAPGPIEDASGRVLGAHRGIARYTVGQRKGLGVGGPEGPYRVLAIDSARNALIVGTAEQAHVSRVVLADPVWRLGEGDHDVQAQIRYRSAPVDAVVAQTAEGLDVSFGTRVESLAPGQSVVLYEGNHVVGGGIVPPREEGGSREWESRRQ